MHHFVDDILKRDRVRQKKRDIEARARLGILDPAEETTMLGVHSGHGHGMRRVKNTLALYGILLATAIPGFFFCKSADYYTAMGLMIGFMGGTLLDDHCVHFENTRKPLWMVARLIGGLAVYLALNTLLKLPFSKAFLSSGTTAALLVRCARYTVVAFVDFGVYPMLFRLER